MLSMDRERTERSFLSWAPAPAGAWGGAAPLPLLFASNGDVEAFAASAKGEDKPLLDWVMLWTAGAICCSKTGLRLCRPRSMTPQKRL